MSLVADAAARFIVTQPYPGLRPFETTEAFLFHGRETHTRALLDRLATERFLAVVGSSGSGKSSLVRAGLLPALYRGYLVGATSRWRIAVMKPGRAPTDALAEALAADTALGLDAARLLEICGKHSLGLTDAVRQANLAAGESVLLVVDQFEELFRFATERRPQDAGAEAALFVQSLLEASEAWQGRLYVVLTMRSDYLGECTAFAGLPEALNRSQYLIPHLSREQRRAAIEQPPLLKGVRIRPALVQRVLNDAGDDPSRLPVLQHALLRTWRRLKPGETEIDNTHYEEAGSIERALDYHATDICRSLPADACAWVEKVFRCLTTLEGRRAVRRPATLARIHRVLGVADDAADRARVNAVITAFALPENSLLMVSSPAPPVTSVSSVSSAAPASSVPSVSSAAPSSVTSVSSAAPGLELRDDSVIDISHESLITHWTALADWRVAETRSAEWYASLVLDTVRHKAGEAGPWRDPELARALELRKTDWNEAWSEQYRPSVDPSFGEVMQFLDLGVQAQRDEKARDEAQQRRELDDARALARAQTRAKRAFSLVAIVLGLLLVLLSAVGYMAWQKREEARRDAARMLEVAAQVNQTASEQAALRRRLQEAADALDRVKASGADGEAQQRKITELEQRLAVSTAAADKARQQQTQVQRNAPAASTEYTAALKQIGDLQAELKEVREERDLLQGQIDASATISVRDASYWKSRFDAADRDLRVAQQMLRTANNPGARERPTIISVPQYSIVYPPGGPLSNVALLLGDLGRLKSSVTRLYVIASGRKDFAAFEDDKASFRSALQTLSRVKSGGDAVMKDRLVIAEFNISKAPTIATTQHVGEFTYSGTVYTIVATGWSQDARADGTDVLSLVLYPDRPAAAATAK